MFNEVCLPINVLSQGRPLPEQDAAGRHADTMGDGKGGQQAPAASTLLSPCQRGFSGRAVAFTGASPCEEQGCSLLPCGSLCGGSSCGGFGGAVGMNPQSSAACWRISAGWCLASWGDFSFHMAPGKGMHSQVRGLKW